MDNRQIIATDGNEEMTLEEFLLWELEGGKGNILADGTEEDWNEMSLEDKISCMANSIRGDFLTGSNPWRLEIK